ncbi:MAG: chorismate synthase [Chloroflexi bacterium]|nr:chorismate synthase [Chloroflexota bacterium]
MRFLTAGESHGKGLTVIVEGIPAGLPIDEQYIAHHLERRQAGYGRSERMKLEKDRAEIMAGVRHGLTLGSPIAMFIQNRVWKDWQREMSIDPVEGKVEAVTRLRPGHADLAGALKYGQRDVRNILERASARDTAARVAAGTVTRRLLEEFGMEIHSHTLSIGEHEAGMQETVDWAGVEKSPVRCADPRAEKEMVKAIDSAKEKGEAIGGVFEVVASGVPIGLGSHVHWDRRLDGILAQAIMSIPAVKGVEVGEGFALTRKWGSQVHDVIQIESTEKGTRRWKHLTNRAGGIEGGITNGEPIIVRAAVKPIATLAHPLPSVDLITGQPVAAHYERSDVCMVPAAGVVGEAMVAWVLGEALVHKFGGDRLEEMRRNFEAYLTEISP